MMDSAVSSILLVDTHHPESFGSMARYGDLVEQALRESASDLRVRRVNLASPASRLEKLPRRLRSVAHHQLLRRAARQLCPQAGEIIHVLDGSYAHVLECLPSESAVVVTSHDLIPWYQHQQKQGPRPSLPARCMIRKSTSALMRATAVVSVSARTREALLQCLGIPEKRIVVSHPPLAPNWGNAVGRERKGFVLHVGNDAFYKNRPGVVKVYARIPQRLRVGLVMAGPAPSRELKDLIVKLGLGGEIRFEVNPEDAVLEKLYATAGLFLFPSLMEGYGWPPLEAAACGCPVIATNVGGVREVLGPEGEWPDASEEEKLANLAARMLEDQVYRDESVARNLKKIEKLSLHETATTLFSVYAEAVSRRETP